MRKEKRPQTSANVLCGGVSASRWLMRCSLASKIHYFLSDSKVNTPNTFMSCVAGLRIAKTARRRIASHGMILGFETRRAIKTFFQCRRSFVWSVEVLVGPDYCTSEDWVSQWGSVLSIVQDPITQALWQDDRTCINIFVKCAIAILVKKWKMVLLKNRQKFELRPSKCWISEWSRKYCSCFWAS